MPSRPLHWPTWLRPLWPGAAILLAWLPVAQVFANPQLPCSDSGLTFLLRAVQFNLNVLGGRPFLSWAPELMHGFGYPVFGFYAPLTTWLLEALHLAGLDFAVATRLAFPAALLAGGLGAMLLIGEDFGQVPAVVAGVAFMYTPYLLFDAIQRGDLPELLGYAAAPWALWLARRAAARFAMVAGMAYYRIIGASLLAVVGLMIVVLSHNMIPIWLSPFLVLACCAPGVGTRRQSQRRTLLAIAIVLAAMAVTAFFWLPALVNLKWVQPWQALAVHNQDYRNNLLPIDQWLTLPPLPVDPAGLLNPPIVRTMGIVTALAALAGMLLAWRLPRAQRRATLTYALIFLVCFGLSTEWARPIWDYVPGMQWFQLPTRFLGLAGLGAAGLAGAAVHVIGRLPRAQAVSGGVLAAAIMLNGLPFTYAPYCATPVNASVRDIATGTHFPYLMTAEGSPEFLPMWVHELPDDKEFAAELDAGKLPDRLDRSLLPAGATAQAQVERPADARWEINSPAPWTALYRSFYYPGWTATLDSQQVAIRITEPYGLMAVDVPAGHHLLAFTFAETAISDIATIFSLLVALGLVAAWFLAWSRRSDKHSAPAEALDTGSGNPPAVAPGSAIAVLVALGLTVGLKWAYLDRVPNPLHAPRLTAAGLAGVSHVTNINFSGELWHLGYDLSPGPITPDAPFVVTQYWTGLVHIGVAYGMEVRLADVAGHVWTLPASRPFGYADYPATGSWPLGAYARDGFLLQLLPGTPPGTYWLETNAFRRNDLFQLVPAASTAVDPDPAWARLGQIEVQPSRSTGLPNLPGADALRPIDLGTGLVLAGWTLPAVSVRAGDVTHATLLWQTSRQLNSASALDAQITDGSGRVLADYALSPGGQGYPLSQWPARAVVRDQLDWHLPASAPSGIYQVSLKAGQTIFPLGQIQITAPDHLFNPPPMATAMNQQIGFARLAGYTLSSSELKPGDTLSLQLAWQATSETSQADRVFVHLRGADGLPMTQSDAVPAQWTRPTTGWVAGEYILDLHNLTLPPDTKSGSYALVVGLYNPASGERLGEISLGAIVVK